MSRGKGHLPDRSGDVYVDLVRRHIDGLVGACSPALPLEIDASPMLEEVPDQGQTSACVGEALATSVYLRAKEAGHPVERPSSKAIYDLARLADMPRKPLVDEGSRPSVAIRLAQQKGLVSESRWPLKASTINEPPPLDVFVHALAARIENYYRIPTGRGAALAAKKALAQGYFPIFAMDVDDAYESTSGIAVYDGPSGPSLGGHMQCLAGYRGGALLVAGSWGRSWAKGGFALISDAFFESSLVSDILVPTVVPGSIS